MARPPRTPAGDPPSASGEETLRAWIDEYGPALRRYFEKRAEPADAEDMVQDVFLAMQVRGGPGGVENARGYLFQVARGVLAHRRYNYPSLGRGLAAHEMGAEELSPERVLLGKEALEKLLSAVDDLPPRSREALLLHRFEEATYASVARRMGITVSAVERLISRALRQVTATLEGRR
ncbi:MAG TPA: sigma-70 family RNA polymerase sigma factor [Caulobacteraceae bacterium]|nr:sigma-70 family RNA polymerase sigma factor [Caulobacteraceae bacterium]